MAVLRPFWPELIGLLLLAAAGPLLYFPYRFPAWAVLLGLALIGLTWPVRRLGGGRWWAPTPADWPLWFWLVVMLPVAIWAAPPGLRQEYAWPRTYIVLWDVALFALIVDSASRDRRRLGWALVGIVGVTAFLATVAIFGMERRHKLPGVGLILEQIPAPLNDVFAGAQGGFSTNQLAGALLYVLPLLIMIVITGRKERTWLWWLAGGAMLWLSGVMILAQSRGGLLGLGAGVLTLALLASRGSWRALLVASLLSVLLILYMPTHWLDVVSDTPTVEALGGVQTVQGFRLVLWEAAYQASQDFFFTGMGFGAFRRIVFMLYPLPGIDPSLDLAHAHNFFLQMIMDFGVPGLIAMLAIYMVAVAQLYRMSARPSASLGWRAAPWITWRILAIGAMGSLAGQTVYSLFDAVAVGSKPSLLWWWLFAVIFAAANLAWQESSSEAPSAEV